MPSSDLPSPTNRIGDAACVDVSTRTENDLLTLGSAVRKARFRLGPFLALMFAISILDRSNVGFAKDALKADVHIGDAAFAVGAGIFFIGYAIFEVPSNLMLHRVGAKVWLSRIMVTWGIASAMMMLVHGNLSFYLLRFLVGVTEAGFSPGVVLYSTYWFPYQERGKALGVYYMGLPAALMLGSVLSGFLMQVMNGYLGLRNWQWMFLIEGLAASVIGLVAFFYLTSKPHEAKWLTASERVALELVLKTEKMQNSMHCSQGLLSDMMNLQLLRFVAIYFTIQVGIYAVIFYLPARVAEMSGTAINSKVGILAAIPWLCALVSLRTLTGYADKSGKHRQYAVVMLMLATAGIAFSTVTKVMDSTLFTFCIATVGFVVVQPLFWTLSTASLSGVSAASGIAVIGTFGNLGGFVAPTLKTAAEQFFHDRNAGMLVLACVSAMGVILLLSMKGNLKRTSIESIVRADPKEHRHD